MDNEMQFSQISKLTKQLKDIERIIPPFAFKAMTDLNSAFPLSHIRDNFLKIPFPNLEAIEALKNTIGSINSFGLVSAFNLIKQNSFLSISEQLKDKNSSFLYLSSISKYLDSFSKINFGYVQNLEMNSGIYQIRPEKANNEPITEELKNENSDSGLIIQPDFITFSIAFVTKILEDGMNLFKLKPRDFEELIADLFYKEGFKVELTPETRDGGKDIIVEKISNLGIIDKYIVECKRYQTGNNVGIDIVQRIYGVKTDLQVNKGIIVTTSNFTKKAKEFALKHTHELDLRDGHQLMLWIKNVYGQRHSNQL